MSKYESGYGLLEGLIKPKDGRRGVVLANGFAVEHGYESFERFAWSIEKHIGMLLKALVRLEAHDRAANIRDGSDDCIELESARYAISEATGIELYKSKDGRWIV